MNYIYNDILKVFLEQRKTLKLTQTQLAEKCGLLQSNIARIESGKVFPGYETITKIARALNLQITALPKNETFSKWQGLEFICFWKDEPSALVTVKENFAYIKKFTDAPIKQLFYSDKLDLFGLSDVLKNRCWSENRCNIDDLLKGIGLTTYDPLEIVKKTHGVSYNDFIWLRFPKETISWEDINPRRKRNV